jgi:HAE1 family hydrophobic/amphiphilic exporter-1
VNLGVNSNPGFSVRFSPLPLLVYGGLAGSLFTLLMGCCHSGKLFRLISRCSKSRGAAYALVKTAHVLRDFSNKIQAKEQVKTVLTQIGQRGFSTRTNSGQITVTLVDESERDISTTRFSANLRQELQAPGVDVNIRGAGGSFGGFSQNIRLSLVGPDIEVLQAISNKIEMVMLADSNVISVDNGRTDPTSELHYHVDRQRISRMGSSLNEVATSLKTQVQGTRVGYLREKGREVPIEVRANKTALTNRDQFFNLELVQVDVQRIPVKALGRFESMEGVEGINRADRVKVRE